MSYGVFRLNGRGGKGLIMIASFEEAEIFMSDCLLKDTSRSNFEEQFSLTEKIYPANAVVRQMSLFDAVQAKEILNAIVNDPYSSAATMSDMVEVGKAPKPKIFCEPLRVEDKLYTAVQNPVDMDIFLIDKVELINVPIPRAIVEPLTVLDIADWNLQYPADTTLSMSDKAEASKTITPKVFFDLVRIADLLEVILYRCSEESMSMSDMVKGRKIPMPEVLYETMSVSDGANLGLPYSFDTEIMVTDTSNAGASGFKDGIITLADSIKVILE